MHFHNSESGNIVSQHNLIGTCCLVCTLYDLKITVSEVEVASIDSHTPGVRQARHYSDTICSVWIAALNLEIEMSDNTISQFILAYQQSCEARAMKKKTY